MSRVRIFAWLVCGLALPLVLPPAFADSPTQARRLRHFEVLQAYGVFSSMSIVDGVPTLVLGDATSQVEPESLKAFCRIIFDYFAEADARHSRIRVVDGATARELAVIDRSGYRVGD